MGIEAYAPCTPPVGMQGVGKLLEPCLVIGVLTLEMLGAQKQAFPPKNFRHSAYVCHISILGHTVELTGPSGRTPSINACTTSHASAIVVAIKHAGILSHGVFLCRFVRVAPSGKRIHEYRFRELHTKSV